MDVGGASGANSPQGNFDTVIDWRNEVGVCLEGPRSNTKYREP
jgi:hypothetical protein